MDYIKTLRRKKKFTGEEVGRALLLCLLYDIQYQQSKDYEPLITPEQFAKMEQSLYLQEDIDIYSVYCSLHKGLLNSYNYGQQLYHRFFSGYARYANTLHLCFKCEEILKNAQKYPLVMTQQQYDRYASATKEKLNSLTETFISLLFHVTRYFVEHIDEAPPEIKTAIEATKEELNTNKRILVAYEAEQPKGYFSLDSGERADESDRENWNNALSKIYPENSFGKNSFRYSKMYYYGAEYLMQEYEKSPFTTAPIDKETASSLIDVIGKMLANNKNADIAELCPYEAPPTNWKEIIDFLIGANISKHISWNEYTNTKKDITKYTVLKHLLGWYSLPLEEKATLKTTAFKEFKADFPELHKTIQEFIFNNVPKAKELKANQYNKPFITFAELAEIDFMNYKELTEPQEQNIIFEFVVSDKNMDKWTRIFWEGIAIITNPKPEQTDENGNFKENILSPFLTFGSLDNISEDKQITQSLKNFKDHLFVPALQYQKGFNAFMEILAEVYELEELREIKFRTTEYEKRVHACNYLNYTLYAEVYGEGEERIRKQKLVKEIFEPVNESLLLINQEEKRAITNELEAMKLSSDAVILLQDFDNYIYRLCGEGVM